MSGTNEATDSSNSGSIGTFPSADIEEIDKVGSSSSPQTSTCGSLTSYGTILGTSFSCTWAP